MPTNCAFRASLWWRSLSAIMVFTIVWTSATLIEAGVVLAAIGLLGPPLIRLILIEKPFGPILTLVPITARTSIAIATPPRAFAHSGEAANNSLSKPSIERFLAAASLVTT